MKQKLLLAAAALIFFVVGVGAALTFRSAPHTPTYLQTYPTPVELKDFSLVRQDNSAFTKADFQDKWTLVFMGYTYCPDICPVTMANLNKIYPQLQALDSQHDIQILFISVDPNRDTPERLAEYVSFFNPSFIAATNEHSELFPLARNLGMMYSMSQSTDDPNYLVDHSSSIVVIDPQARVIGRFKPQLEPGKLAVSDTEQILADMPILVKG